MPTSYNRVLGFRNVVANDLGSKSRLMLVSPSLWIPVFAGMMGRQQELNQSRSVSSCMRVTNSWTSSRFSSN